MSYCTKCGKEEIGEWTGRFDHKTGEKTMRQICPEAPCEHSGHEWRWRSISFWEALKCSKDMECERCGKRTWGY